MATFTTSERKYWVIIFVQNRPDPIKWHVTNKSFRPMFYWLANNHPTWTAINVYKRYSQGAKGEFVIQLTPLTFWSKIQNL